VHTHQGPDRAAEIAHDVMRRAEEFGIHVRDAEVDFAAVMARVRRLIDEGTRDDLMHATELPGHLVCVCVGAGAVSLEFARPTGGSAPT
jgi:pyruvate/2-oxoglutarate dehydrogenase complex dihydrolipoamide dehydrogenase (E3) component